MHRTAQLFTSLIVLLVACATASVEAAAAGGTAPVMVRHEGREIVMANGIVTVTIDPTNAQVTGLRVEGHELVSNAGRHRAVYFSRDGGSGYEQLPHCVATIVSKTPEMVHLRCTHTYTPSAGDKHAWDVDAHFILRRGVSGLYVYAVCHHPAAYPKVGVGEWRMVWSTPEGRDALDTIYVDDARHWLAPDLIGAEPVPGAPKEVTRVTRGSWAGKLDCKYEYAAQYWDLDCWGFADSHKHVGAFVVFPSHEWFNDGPYKQDLTAAVGTTLVHLNMNHFGGTAFTIDAGQAWTKCYGPWMLYANAAPSADDCWHEAQACGLAEAAQWPYPWVKDPAYPPADKRANVHGQLVVRDPLQPGLSVKGAWVGLAPAADADFQFSATGYQFWAHAGADGTFELPHVRPGEYTLYAVVDGEVGQFARKGIVVQPGHDLALGEVAWTVPHPGRRIAWQIGVPNRRSVEFFHGKDYFEPLLYQKLWTQTPDPLEYTIGKSDPAKDWVYAQTIHKTNRQPVAPRWRIHFNLDAVPSGDAMLVLAFAGADHHAKVAVLVNGESPADRVAEVVPPVQGGNGLVREANHTKYSNSEVRIPAGRLRAGANTITLEQQSLGDDAYVMYDAVRLELP